MQTLKRFVGILLLLAFLSVKCTILFSQTKEQVKTAWTPSEDQSENNSEKEEETKEVKSPFDELVYDVDLIYVDLPSRTIHTHYLQGAVTHYLSSVYLPPEC